MNQVSKSLIILGIVLVVIGITWHFLTKFNIPIGKLPGDIHIKGKNSSFYFPLTTSILLSIVLSAIAYFFRK